jgi:hypothetical protein
MIDSVRGVKKSKQKTKHFEKSYWNILIFYACTVFETAPFLTNLTLIILQKQLVSNKCAGEVSKTKPKKMQLLV